MTRKTLSTDSQLTLQVDSQLIEDYLHTQNILVDATLAQPMAVFPNQSGETEALVIDQAGQISHVCREPLSDSGWNMYSLGAGFKSLACNSGFLWGLGYDYAYWRNDGGRWSPFPVSLPNMSEYAPLDVSVTSDGVLFVITESPTNNAFVSQPPHEHWSWLLLETTGLAQAPVGSFANLWSTSRGGSVLHSIDNGWSWDTVAPLPGGDRAARVAMGADGSVWSVSRTHRIYQYVDAVWQPMPGAPDLVCVGVVDATNIWGVGADGSVYQFANSTWQPCATTIPLDLSMPCLTAAADGTVYSLDRFGMPWRFTRAANQWQRYSMPTGMSGLATDATVSEVVAAQDEQNTPHAFFVQAGRLNHAVYRNGGWSFPDDVSAPCGQIGLARQHDTRQLIAYGVDSSNNLVFATGTGGRFSEKTVPCKAPLAGVKVNITAWAGDDWFVSAVIGGALCVNWGNSDNPLAGRDKAAFAGVLWAIQPNSAAPGRMKEIIRLPWVTDAPNYYAGAIDEDGNIWMVFDTYYYQATLNSADPHGAYGWYVQRSGTSGSPLGAVASSGAVVDAGGNARLYAVDTNQTLWVIRQIGSTGNVQDPWAWTGWHPLGDRCSHLADGPGLINSSEFYILDDDHFLTRISQNPVSLIWKNVPVCKPATAVDDPIYMSQYVTDVTLVDGHGLPQPNVPVTIGASEPVSFWAAGTQYVVDAATTVTIPTNSLGKITVSSLALHLHTPQLTFNAAGLAQPVCVYPPQCLQSRLSIVDAATLQNANSRTKGQPPVTKPLLPNSTDPNLDAATTAIRGAWAVQASAGIDPSKVARPRTASSQAAIPGDVWSDLLGFAEDIYHAVQTGFIKVKAVSIDVKQFVVRVILSIEDIGDQAIEFVIATMEDVIQAIQSAFKWVLVEVQDVIDWLKSVFEWDDILNTKRVIDYLIGQVLTNVANTLGPSGGLQRLINVQFQSLAGSIDDAFTKAGSVFQGSSFNGAVQNYSVPPSIGVGPLDGSGLQKTFGANQVKCNYVHAKSQAYFSTGGEYSKSSAAAPALAGDPFGDFLTQVETLLSPSDLNSPFSVALADLQGKLQTGVQNPNGFFDMAICDVLDLLKAFVDFVLTVIKDLVLLFLDLVETAIKLLQSGLEAQIDIPVLSWLYPKISGGDPLTLLDVLSLMIAMPVTVLYKPVFGGANLDPPFTSEQVEQILNQPMPWPPIAGTTCVPSPGPKAAVAAGDSWAGWAAFLTALIAMGQAPCETANDFCTWEKTPAPALSITSIILGLAGLGVGAPYKILERSADTWTEADEYVVALWGARFLPLLLNIGFVVMGKNKSLAQFTKESGLPLVSIMGGMVVALGIYTASLEAQDSKYTRLHQTQAIIARLPLVFKPLLLIGNPIPATIVMTLDFLCDIGNGALTIAENFSSTAGESALGQASGVAVPA
jgi:hypothetical protein